MPAAQSRPGVGRTRRVACIAAGATALGLLMTWIGDPQQPAAAQSRTFLGCDLNQYPGDDAMRQLRQDCAFTGYWLSPPPGEKTSTWQGKREFLRKLGYGFLPLYLGPLEAQLKSADATTQQGARDGQAAVDAARREGFLPGTIIFSDIEEGGRLSPSYHAYLRGWSAVLRHAGYRPGAYCSGMPVNEGQGVSITTAADIRNDPAMQDFLFWVYNDGCPPSRGCEPLANPRAPSGSGVPFAAVWQFAQSPRRKAYTARCPAKYAPDGNCYAPSDAAHRWFLDLNSSLSPDPSYAGL